MKLLCFHFIVWFTGPDGFVHVLWEKCSSVMTAVWGNGLSSAGKSSGAGSNKVNALWATGVPSLSGEQCGWPQFLTLPPVVRIQPTLLPSVLYHQSPGDDKKSAQKCKTTFFYWKNFWNENVQWDDWRAQKRYPEMAKYETKASSGIWHSKSSPSLHQRGSIFYEPLPLQNRSTDVPPSHQSAELTSMRKASVLWVDVRMWAGSMVWYRGDYKEWWKERVGSRETDSILSLSKWPWSCWTYLINT